MNSGCFFGPVNDEARFQAFCRNVRHCRLFAAVLVRMLCHMRFVTSSRYSGSSSAAASPAILIGWSLNSMSSMIAPM
ncbi:hypothetical protein D3C85_1841090 [compost metagenome]